MFQFGSCPRCQSEIAPERLGSQPIICQNCGFTAEFRAHSQEQAFERRFLMVALGFAIVMVASFIQAANWDRHALKIIPLKIKQILNVATAQELNQIASICLERFKHNCVEEAYADLAHSGQLESLADLGKYQARRGKSQQALATFKQYFAQGGLDLEASYQFAKVLGESGQVELATNYFDHVLKAKPDTMQISVTQSYVRMLINNGRREQAVKLIRNIRATSPSAALFMENELKSLSPQARLR